MQAEEEFETIEETIMRREEQRRDEILEVIEQRARELANLARIFREPTEDTENQAMYLAAADRYASSALEMRLMVAKIAEKF